MQHDLRHRTLADFLQSRRARLNPNDVGLPAAGRRRTPGLRREEVAYLSGVGLTWYTWLEQGRPISVSEQVIESIARALQLDQYETRYLFTLARLQAAPAAVNVAPATEAVETVSPAMRVLLDNQGVFPAFILGRYWDIIAWNRSASLLLGGLESLPIEQRNHVWLMFGSPMIRQSLIDWDVHAHRMIAEFRVSCGHYLDDPKFADLIARLMTTGDEFRAVWERHDVVGRQNICKAFSHPTIGTLSFEQTTLLVSESPDHRLVVKIPLPGMDTLAKLTMMLQ